MAAKNEEPLGRHMPSRSTEGPLHTMAAPPSLSNLPRFPLSTILAYLQQHNAPSSESGNLADAPSSPLPLPHNRDALSLLLTCKRFARAILPLYRVPSRICRNYQCTTASGRLIAVVEKYRFAALPVQDPRTLLDRLNTRRLRGRIIWMKKSSSTRDAEGSEGVEVEIDSASGGNGFATAKGRRAHIEVLGSCYQHGRTIEELAFEEWAVMEIHYSSGVVDHIDNIQWNVWPSHLELLRFLDDDSSGQPKSGGKGAVAVSDRRKRIPSPFCFRSASNKQRADIDDGTSQMDLSEGHLPGNEITLLSSYPRSGNTLLRTLLEKITSTVTGSDTRADRTLSKSLALEHNLVGEGLVGCHRSASKSSIHQHDPLVHVVKTHFPERKGWSPVEGDRVLLLVRNPYDAIDSYWNLCCTNTHTRTLDESVYSRYSQKFEDLARHEIQIWCDFHYYWLDTCNEKGVPLLVVRYEDLVLDTEAEMLRIIEFLICHQRGALGVKRLKSFWKWRIRHALGLNKPDSISQSKGISKYCDESNREAKRINTTSLGSYQPRSSGGGLSSIGKSLRKKRYRESVLCHMHEVAVSLELSRKQTSKKNDSSNKTLLQQFGYDIYTQQFPGNFVHPPTVLQSSPDPGKQFGRVVINKAPEIRSENDPFGRAMTFWRRGETNNDTNPFPTVSR